ncbi:TonB-dependent receptor [Sphingomonas ginkgonis]|uniref:TonB-dependent receptor n=1 Tax=Sphingomonas ginkgonis TaxID=2315330 RepID=A0A429VCC2_9SPHN|nr:TonB-dependent receptor [Sphingomonas ginkgonis]RST31526.1 TonB-dependent receptor [Sphingomonas ginkgonis]
MTAWFGVHGEGLGRSLLVSASVLALAAVGAPVAALAQQAQPDPQAQADANQGDTPPKSTTDPTATPTPENGSVPRDSTNQAAAVAPADAGGEIVVTGLRHSVETAQALKYNSDQFVDSITATDIGKLPDRNVAEALQRISGVQISRNYGEGSGIAIRGLTQVKTELNGRDVFGGSGGRALGFEDVPSELLAGVDVYKDPSAKEIEGGIGGLVNLRTRMPFDQKGFLVAASIGANYFDLSKKTRPNGSLLLSKIWNNTSIGDFGLLVDLSYYDAAFRRDQATIEPYVPSTTIPGHVGETLYLPDGAGIQVTEGKRKRRGLYAAAQWDPASNLHFYGTFFQSRYKIYTPNYSSFVTNSTSSDYLNYMQPNSSGFSFAPDGTFVSGGYNGFVPAYSAPPYVNTALNVLDNTQVAFSKTVTTDWAGGVKWQPTQRLHADLDLQYERATAQTQSYTAFTQKDLAGYNVDLSGGLPSITFQAPPGGASIYDLVAYRFTAIMDHLEDSVATQKAARLDLQWDFDGILTSIQGGLRYTDREAINRSTPYNWTSATPTNADGSPLNLANPISQGVPAPYGALFGGAGADIIGPVPYASAHLFDDPAAAFQTIGGRAITTFGPLDINTQREKTYAGYLAAYFKFDAAVPIDGNIAVRVVKTDNNATGSTRLNYRPDLLPTTSQVTVDQPYSASQSYTKLLPSINLRAHLTPQLQLRAAASKGLARPEFYQLNANRTLSIGYNQVLNGTVVTGYVPSGTNTGGGGNPYLKPLTVDQTDLALEWNASRSTFLYGTLFYKKLKNFIQGVTSNQQVDVPGNGTQTFLYSGYANGTRGTVKGAELGGNTFFDFLPGALSGLGAQANVTYVDSSAPGATGTLANGQQVPTQLQGLSKWSYNIVGLYEKFGISARVAYNWRSSYLADSAGNGTGGIPIYNHAYGQLDASLTYNVTPKASITVDATNLTKERYDSYQYYPQNPRNFELNDRRFGVTLRLRN